MNTSRRSAILGTLLTGLIAQPLWGCAPAKESDQTLTRVHVMGVIHSGHLESQSFSLQVLEAAIRKARPDVVLTEIPPDRIDQALTSFQETGVIDEPRTQVFPEYTEVLFPLSREMDFRILGTAGWTREIADNRREALQRIQSDPVRADQWEEHQAARRRFARELGGRGDDPRFVHTEAFDRLVEAAYKPYQQHFDADLGPGGWTQINRAHTDLINAALDMIAGKGLSALVTFGSAHKYKILRSLGQRDDIELLDTRALFT